MMRKLMISFVIAAFAILSLSAQDIDKILSDHFKASGQEKLSKITSTTLNGKMVAMGMETGVTLYQERPNKLRFEASFAGSDIIQTFNGTTGWTYAPGMGLTQPQEMGAEELKGILLQADMDSPLWDFEAKGNKVELAGNSEDGSSYLVKLTTADNDEMTIGINKETSLISKVITSQMANGMETEIEIVMKDYKDVKGIPTAHNMETKMGGQVISTITFESIEYNKTLDPALFEKPVIE